MKKYNLKFIMFIFILATGFSSCQKGKVCNVNNPKKDLPWLKELIGDIEKETKAGCSRKIKIYQCTYGGGIDGFMVSTHTGDRNLTSLRDCEGTSLCINGIGINDCTRYGIDYKHKKLIYKHKK
jgi:hypothetical protein